MTNWQADRQTDRQTDTQTERRNHDLTGPSVGQGSNNIGNFMELYRIKILN